MQPLGLPHFHLVCIFIKAGDGKDGNNTSQWDTIQIKLLIINNIFGIYIAATSQACDCGQCWDKQMKGAEDSSEAVRILNLPRGTIRYLNNKYHLGFFKPEPDKTLTLRNQILRWKMNSALIADGAELPQQSCCHPLWKRSFLFFRQWQIYLPFLYHEKYIFILPFIFK